MYEFARVVQDECLIYNPQPGGGRGYFAVYAQNLIDLILVFLILQIHVSLVQVTEGVPRGSWNARKDIGSMASCALKTEIYMKQQRNL